MRKPRIRDERGQKHRPDGSGGEAGAASTYDVGQPNTMTPRARG